MLPELFSIFFLGVLNGMTVCSLSCMPVLGSYLMITGNGFGDGVVSVLAYVGGKTVSYTMLGGIAALFGTVLVAEGLPYVKLTSGLFLVAAGLSIPFLKKLSCSNDCGLTLKRASLFTLGLSSGLVPCPSLAAVFLLAATKASIVTGAIYGMAFGFGLAVSPLLLLGGMVARISKTIKEKAAPFMPTIQVISVVILVGLGVRTMIQEV